ncbi:hypothetical protein F2P56_027457, partial [Juglans regia]
TKFFLALRPPLSALSPLLICSSLSLFLSPLKQTEESEQRSFNVHPPPLKHTLPPSLPPSLFSRLSSVGSSTVSRPFVSSVFAWNKLPKERAEENRLWCCTCNSLTTF